MNKKITLLLFSILTCSFAFGQVAFGVKGGVTESFLQDRVGSAGQNYNFRTGYQVGTFVEIPLNRLISLRPSLQLTQKGFKKFEGTPGTSFYWNRNFSTDYLELPLDVVYNFYLNQNAEIQVGTGPVFGLGVFGKNKTIITGSDSTGQPHTEYWEGTDAFDKRFDFGWEFLFSMRCHRASISLNYNHGLFNVLNDGNHTAKNRSFALTLGYLLKSR
jgi:hypothetical protein